MIYFTYLGFSISSPFFLNFLATLIFFMPLIHKNTQTYEERCSLNIEWVFGVLAKDNNVAIKLNQSYLTVNRLLAGLFYYQVDWAREDLGNTGTPRNLHSRTFKTKSLPYFKCFELGHTHNLYKVIQKFWAKLKLWSSFRHLVSIIQMALPLGCLAL